MAGSTTPSRPWQRYEWGLAWRTAVLALTCCAVGYFGFVLKAPYTAGLFFLLGLFQVWNLSHYLRRQVREWERFVESLRLGDTTQSWNGAHAEPALAQLHRLFNEISEGLKNRQQEQEQQSRFLQALLDSLPSGLLAVNEAGEVVAYNRALQEWLDTPYLARWDGLQRRHGGLFRLLISMKAGDIELVSLRSREGNEQEGYQVEARFFQTGNQLWRVFSFRDVSQLVDKTETEAWNRLMRILTHEIMNSIAPVTSLAETLHQSLQTEAPGTWEDVRSGIEVIHKRSQGLLHFVQAYRNLNSVPRPDLRPVPVSGLLETLDTLLAREMKDRGIRFVLRQQQEGLTLQADPHLIEQVLINLLRNAVEATTQTAEPHIEVVARASSHRGTVIEVRDNGIGIAEELVPEIFVPFFSTKKNGTGVGLSLSRQIMQQHRGTLSYQPGPEGGSVFRLLFPG